MPAALTMLPPAAALPAVLPTERLGLSAKPKSPLRDELRRIPTLHNLWSIVALVATAVGVLAGTTPSDMRSRSSQKDV